MIAAWQPGESLALLVLKQARTLGTVGGEIAAEAEVVAVQCCRRASRSAAGRCRAAKPRGGENEGEEGTSDHQVISCARSCPGGEGRPADLDESAAIAWPDLRSLNACQERRLPASFSAPRGCMTGRVGRLLGMTLAAC